MRELVIHSVPVFPERPTNPARCYLQFGVIEVNERRMKELTPYAQKYVLLHEMGHYYNQSLSEVAADRYALNKLAYSEPYSLRKYLDSVREVSYDNRERMTAATKDVLTLQAKRGNQQATEILRNNGYNVAAADGSLTKNISWLGIMIICVAMITLVLTFEQL